MDPAAITRLTDQQQPLTDAELTDAYATPADPWLRVNFVTSVDGAVAVAGVSGALSSPADQQLLGCLRGDCDALLVGAGTFRDEGYGPIRLASHRRARRQARGQPPHPRLVLVSSRLALDPRVPALAEAPVRPIVLTHATAPADRRAALAATTEVIVAGEETVDLGVGLAQLHHRGLTQLLCEGGPQLLGALTAADLVDEVCLTISPVLAGPGAGRITAGPASALRRLTLHQTLGSERGLFLRYLRRPAAEAVG